jgi:hypothetical protein
MLVSLEWFDRVSGELQDHLESICSKYDQVGHLSIERGAKYPRMEFFVETEENDRDFFCTILFDSVHEEFFFEEFDPEYGHTSRTILADIEDIVDIVHESLHDYLNGDTEVEEIYEEFETDQEDDFDSIQDDEGEYYLEENEGTSGDIFEEIDVEWETPEVTAFIHKDEVEITYQFGVVQETGDGVLKRINRIWTEEEELIKDESHFIFSKEEANTIIALIATHMDSLSEFDFES